LSDTRRFRVISGERPTSPDARTSHGEVGHESDIVGQRLEHPRTTAEPTALSQLSDEALLAEFQSGLDAAFDVLYRRYRDRILAYVRGMMSNREMAEEVYNTTMYQVYARLPAGLAAGQFRKYLYRAAFNTSLNANRRETNLSRTPGEGLSWGGALVESFAEADPEQRLSGKQRLLMARQFLETLPADRRAALLLYHNDGRSYQEIAEVLGKPVGTIRWLIHEARAAMASHLERHEAVRLERGDHS